MFRKRIATVALAALLLTLSAPPAAAVPFPGLVAYWQAENNALDSAGRWDMIALNGTTYAPGVMGQAFVLDGVDDTITLGTVTISAMREDVGISYLFWANIPVDGGGYVVGAEGLGGQGYGGVHLDGTNNRVSLHWTATNPNLDVVHGATAPITPGNWHHVAVVADFSGDSLSFYLDGQPLALDFESTPVTDYTPDSSFTPAGGTDTVGARFVNGSVVEHFEGMLDQMLIYHTPLTPADVLGIYGEQVPEPASGALLLLGLVATAVWARARR